MTGRVELRGSGEERGQCVASALIAQHIDELDAGSHLAGYVAHGPKSRHGLLQQGRRRLPERIADPADEPPQQKPGRLIPAMLRPHRQPSGKDVGGDRSVTPATTRSQHPAGVVPVAVLSAEPVGPVEVAALDQTIHRSGHRATQLPNRKHASNDAVPQVMHDKLAAAREIHKGQTGQDGNGIDRHVADRGPHQRRVTPTNSCRHFEQPSLLDAQVVENRFPHVLGSTNETVPGSQRNRGRPSPQMRQRSPVHPMPVSELLQLARVQRQRRLIDLDDLARRPQPGQPPRPTSTRKHKMHRQRGVGHQPSQQSRPLTR